MPGESKGMIYALLFLGKPEQMSPNLRSTNNILKVLSHDIMAAPTKIGNYHLVFGKIKICYKMSQKYMIHEISNIRMILRYFILNLS